MMKHRGVWYDGSAGVAWLTGTYPAPGFVKTALTDIKNENITERLSLKREIKALNVTGMKIHKKFLR